ncbi:MAG: glycosyl hydrolase [Chthoniobacterales bacterium]|nr:glycosyl hydrolase [Chthoniobacterales bacterium]
MLSHFGHASRVLLSGLLAGSLLFGLTTAAESQSSKAKPRKPEATPESAVFSNASPSPAAAKAPEAQGAKKGQFDEQLWSGMKWREVGPYRGGRAIAIEGVPDEPNTYYFGGVAGGVWKTTDGGANWKPMFDKQHGTSSIGAIAVSPSDHNTIYAGAGESALRGNITYGDGVYKSVDGGRNWRNVGLKDTRHISALIVHPENPDIVFVAAVGHAYGPNAERGVFRTTDGGKSWTKVLFKDENTGAIDIVFDPHNPNTLFAAMWQVRRQPWFLSSGGAGSGLYRSTDSGNTWQELKGHGFPEGILGRIGTTVSGADSNRIYAIIEAKEGGIFRSEDGGDSWEKINDDLRFRQRAWYFSKVYADPRSVDTLYVLNTGLFRSVDGGKTFKLLPARHGDHHGLWIDPKNPNRIGNANDGGASVSIDGGETWSTLNNQPTAQFYHVAVDNAFPYHIYGAQQDNSNVGIASRSPDGVIGREDWFQAGGGECGFVLPDPRDWHIIYSNNEGFITRYDKSKEQYQDVSVWPLDHSGHGAEDLKHRFQWVSPLLLSPHNPDTIYTAGEAVFKSTDQGHSWTAISEDLTRNDKSKQKPSGGPIQNDITSVEYYDTIFALAESPLKKGMLWAGTDDGLLHVTTDDGATWQRVPPNMPEWSHVSLIDRSHFDAGIAYVAVDRHRLDDFKPYIFKTTDTGRNWTAITNGIPEGAYVRAVREDPKRRGLLYAGTELGVYVSFDDGAHWQSLQINLPTSPIHDLVVKDDDLVVATHGRSFWVLDNLTPLRQVNDQVTQSEMKLYAPQTAYRLHYPEEVDSRQPVGTNPPSGAMIDYYLKDEPKGEVTVEILDAQGKTIRHLSSKEKKEEEQPPEWPDQIEAPKTIPAKAGMNRFAWDLRYDHPVLTPGTFYYGSGPRGALALPGTYQVRLTTNGKSETAPLQLAMDPRLKGAEEGMRKSFELSMKVNERFSQLHQAINEIRETKSQLDSFRKHAAKEARLKPALDAADDMEKKMSAVEEKLLQVNMKSSEGNLVYPNQLNEEFYTFSKVVEADAAPTQPQLEVFKILNGRLDEQLKAWSQIKSEEVPKVNGLIKQADLPALTVAEAIKSSPAPAAVASPTPTIPILPNEAKPPAMPTASPPR